MSNQIILIPLLLFLYLPSSSSSDTLTSSQLLTGNQTLISAGQKFELGFFSPDGADANKLYLGIWYFNLPVKTIAWIANRDFPARNSSVSLKLGIGGQIVLSEQGAAAVWSSSHSNATNPVLQLLDSGNLVVHDADDSNAENYVWQSFDYPTDTLLPGQKLGWDKKSGLDRYLTSWKSSIDPSSGDYMFRLDRAGDPQLCIIINGSQIIFRTGPWVGQRFSGVPPMNSSPTITFTFQDNPDEAVYYEVNEADPTLRSRLFVDPRGTLRRYTWEADTWNVYWFAPKDQCDQYMACGPYGLCDASGLFVCGCPQGFGPKDPSAWAQRDASSGCARKTRLDCATDGFVVLGSMKLPDSAAAVVDKEKGLKECRETCRKDCNCTAFASWQVVNGVGSGCLMWTGDLKDMRKYPENGQDLYVRVDASDVDDSDKTKKVAIGVSVSVGLVMILLAVAACFVCKRKHPLPSNYRVSRLGVRVSSKRALAIDNEDGNHIEMGLHVFFGCYNNLFRLMKKVGADKNLLVKDHTHTFVNRGGEIGELDFRFPVGAPIHGIRAFLATNQLKTYDKARNAVALALSPVVRALVDPDGALQQIRDLDSVSFSDWFMSKGGTRASIQRMWDPVAYALGFIDCDNISARCMLTIFSLFATKTEASLLRMLKGSPDLYLSGPIRKYIEDRGGRFHLRWGCREILHHRSTEGDTFVTGLAMSKATNKKIVTADAYVAACDVPGIKRLLPKEWKTMIFFDNIYKLVGVPVVTVQLRYNGWVTELQDLNRSRQLKKAAGLDNLLYTPDADFSCFADLALTSPEDYYVEGQGSLLQCVLTPGDPYMPLVNEEIIKKVSQQVLELFPSARGLEVTWSSVVKIAESLYREGPGKDPFRPDQSTPVENFFLAGSYTKQDYIDSMEGATLSGRQTSAYICEAGQDLFMQGEKLRELESQNPSKTSSVLSFV